MPIRLPVRPTIRLRLTLAYGAMFLVAGGLLLAVNYVFVRNSLNHDRVAFTVEAGPAPVTGPLGPEPLIIEG